MLEGITIYKKLWSHFNISKEKKIEEEKRINLHNIEKNGFGKKILKLSDDFSIINILKQEDYGNKFESKINVKDIIRVYIPYETQRILNFSKNSSKLIQKNLNLYEIFVIINKNERMHLITDDYLNFTKLIHGLNAVISRKSKAHLLINNILCFCVLAKESEILKQ